MPASNGQIPGGALKVDPDELKAKVELARQRREHNEKQILKQRVLTLFNTLRRDALKYIRNVRLERVFHEFLAAMNPEERMEYDGSRRNEQIKVKTKEVMRRQTALLKMLTPDELLSYQREKERREAQAETVRVERQKIHQRRVADRQATQQNIETVELDKNERSRQSDTNVEEYMSLRRALPFVRALKAKMKRETVLTSARLTVTKPGSYLSLVALAHG
jgi:hypothetical protein